MKIELTDEQVETLRRRHRQIKGAQTTFEQAIRTAQAVEYLIVLLLEQETADEAR